MDLVISIAGAVNEKGRHITGEAPRQDCGGCSDFLAFRAAGEEVRGSHDCRVDRHVGGSVEDRARAQVQQHTDEGVVQDADVENHLQGNTTRRVVWRFPHEVRAKCNLASAHQILRHTTKCPAMMILCSAPAYLCAHE